MSLDDLISIHQPEIEKTLREALGPVKGAAYGKLHTMMCYHLGWEGEGAGPKASGKRIRPLLVTLTTEAAGGDWRRALPAAAAVELVHNFSLLHDDIEDNSPLRRGRPTVWKKWGIPQAINTGDSMFALAHLAMHQLIKLTSLETAFNATRILERTCLELTQGQFLDIDYEDRNDLSLENYWLMITGKTGALIAACTELGALIAGTGDERQENFRMFGLNLGLAFQVLDDYLGMWGEPAKTGKSIASDLLERKKSLPVLFGLSQKGDFAQRWLQGPIQPAEVSDIAHLLASEGALDYTQTTADRLTEAALKALAMAKPSGEAGESLFQLARRLLQREV